MYVAALVLGVAGGLLSLVTQVPQHIAVGVCRGGDRIVIDIVGHLC